MNREEIEARTTGMQVGELAERVIKGLKELELDGGDTFSIKVNISMLEPYVSNQIIVEKYKVETNGSKKRKSYEAFMDNLEIAVNELGYELK